MPHGQNKIVIDGLIYEAPELAVEEVQGKLGSWTLIGPEEQSNWEEVAIGHAKRIADLTTLLGKYGKFDKDGKFTPKK